MSKRSEIEEAVQTIRRDKELFEMGINQMDDLLILRYKHLQEVGFTKDEAFKIILEKGIG